MVRLDIDDAEWAWRLRDLKFVNAASSASYEAGSGSLTIGILGRRSSQNQH